ncbi:probable glutathione S-transferase [Pistacia vera]|uniref:probable glutathione S-transferase n=1 Tax=Pistacia vera TaxID=55513 RepID=UPI001262FE89|nr:probable glutathione S-transferase [Pistacia vera]
MEEVKVIGASPSAFCVRIEWALMLKGITYEYIEENLKRKSNLLLQSNPVHKKVPVLLHNGKPISESLVILEYIEDTWKHNPLLPADPVDRATVRFWAKYIDDECVFSALAAYRAQGHEKEKAVESAQQKLEVLNEQVQNKKLFGEK